MSRLELHGTAKHREEPRRTAAWLRVVRGPSRLFAVCLAVAVLAACGAGNDPANQMAANAPMNAPVNTASNAPPSNQPEEDTITPEHREATRLYEEAWDLIATGDNTGALELLERAVKILPENHLIHERMGYAYMKLLRFDDSRDAYLKAADLTKRPDARVLLRGRAAWCSHRLAIEAMNKNDLAAALTHLEQSIEMDNSSVDVHMLHGEVLLTISRFPEAAAAFAAAADLASGERRNEARSQKGRAQFQAGEYRKALETFTALIDEGIDKYEVYGWRGFCHVQIGNKAEAISDFTQAARRTTDPEMRANYEDRLRELEKAD